MHPFTTCPDDGYKIAGLNLLFNILQVVLDRLGEPIDKLR
jgi:hypothetical protein